jgi:putative tryptophan/tyrosine transport system substrate-binding protein
MRRKAEAAKWPAWKMAIAGAILCTLSSVLPVKAQPAPLHARVGLLTFNTPEAGVPFRDALLQGLNALGYVQGQNLTLLARYAHDDPQRVVPLARELTDSGINVLVVTGAATPDTLRAVREIPVIYVFSGDPVAAGWASSLAAPNDGATGITWMSIELNGKRIELLKEAFPALRRLAILANPLHPGEDLEIAECHRAAEALGISLLYLPARDTGELEAALQRLDAEGGADAIIAVPDMLMVAQRARIIEFAAERRMPVISGWARFAHSGALLTYGPNLANSVQRLAGYVHRVLTGTRPSALPIEQPTTFELVVNLKAARRLGIELPPMLLARADEVIE